MFQENKAKKIVLVVDDDPLLLMLYKELFNNKGVEVKVAQDGQEGLELIRQEKPDFVILDIRMPKLDGIDVLKIMRKDNKLKDIPVSILTNYDLQDYREKTKDLNIVDFWVKTNIDPAGLVKRVAEFLSDKKQ